MQWFEIIRKATALLSRMYLVMVICLATWAVLPLLIGWTPTVVMSGSMVPSAQIGDVLVAQPLSATQKEELISVGNVLLATSPVNPSKLVTHRVVNILKGTGYITKGDANATADATVVPVANVHGIERLRIPMIGIPIQTIREGNYIPAIIFGLLAMFAQFILFHERTAQRAIKMKTIAPPVVKVSKKELHKPIIRHLKKKKRCMASQIALVSSMLMILSLVFAGSAAVFFGTSANSGHNFQTASDFSVAYKNGVIADSPFAYYRLNEASGTTVTDFSNNARSAKYSTKGITYSAPTALTRDTADKSITLNGSQGTITGSTATAGPQALSLEIWFKTTTTTGGKLIGFNAGTATSTTADRVLYMTNTGKIMFGIDTATAKTIQTPLSYNDGKWHMAVATLSGMNASLYIDGALVSSGTTTSAPTTASGYWVAGGVTFTGWLNQPTSSFFSGSLDEIAIYTYALTSAQISADYGAA